MAAIDREIVKRGTLYDFVKMAWSYVEPMTFVPNWHLEEICVHLEAVSRYEITNLVINIPPGTGKSLIVGVFWPVWFWIKEPSTRYISMSFDASLTARDGGRIIKLLSSDWFIERWGAFLDRPNPAESNFENRWGGFRFGSSISGKATGRHGNVKIVDDPIKPLDADGGVQATKVALKRVSDWWGGTMSSRVADHSKNANVIVMQRLHEEDLAGECLATGNYVHLCFPMRFESDRACVTQWGGDRRTVEGELLFPNRIPEQSVKALETAMGPDVTASQLQQRPTRKGGNVFKREWWKHWTPETLPSSGIWVQSWDFTFKKTDTSDYVCGGIWLASFPNFYLIHLINRRMNFSESVQAVREMSKEFPLAWDKYVEDAANGPAIQNTLETELPGIIMVPPLGGKEARANATTPLYAAGRVFLPPPDLYPWVRPYMAQHESFPRGVNDDMVDMTSQALCQLRQFSETFPAAMAAIRGE